MPGIEPSRAQSLDPERGQRLRHERAVTLVAAADDGPITLAQDGLEAFSTRPEPAPGARFGRAVTIQRPCKPPTTGSSTTEVLLLIGLVLQRRL